MEVGPNPSSCPLPSGPLNELFKGRRSEPEQKALREEMRHRLHPITCRICRQELAYFRDVGRFPLEEEEVQGAYLQGRGYRFLLTVWWGRVSDHLPGDLKEMPAVSSYYRHMSFHLGVRTEREGAAPPAGPSYLARSGGFTSSPDAAPAPPAGPSPPSPTPMIPGFHVVIPVPMPEDSEGASWSPARVESPPRVERTVLRMAKTMVELDELSSRPLRTGSLGASSRSSMCSASQTNAQAASRDRELLGRAAGASSGAGGYAMRMSPPQPPEPRRRKPSVRPS